LRRDTAVTGVTEVQAGRGPARDTILLGKYRVEATLGFGGMGVVIKAHNMAIDEYVAIKLLRDDVRIDQANIARFLREAKNAVKLKSEHVARIRDVGTFDDGRPYMVMELLEGADLGRVLLDHGKLERARAVDLVLQACDALAEAHALGIVHRDIKPTNLFVTLRRDDSELLKVLDFGISKAREGPELSLTQTSSMLGTPAYMSPEQMRSARAVDPRSDIWSLGTVLYELVEGRAPFDAQNFAELCVMVSTEPYAPLRVAPELASVIDRCLVKRVEERYQDISELAFALQPFASDPERARRSVNRIYRILGTEHPDGRDSTPTPFTLARRGDPSSVVIPRAWAPTMPPAPAKRRWTLFALLLVLLGAAIGAGVWAMSPDKAAPQPAAAPAAAGSGSTMTVEQPDAAVVVEPVTVDAAVPEVGIGSADEKRSAVKKSPSPPKKPSKKPPVKQKQPPPAAGSEPPPPKPKCDVWDNPKGCT